MSLFHNIIYHPTINKLLRNVNYVLSPILPSKIKLYPSGKLKIRMESVGSIYFKTNQTSFLTRELFWKGPEKFEFTKIFTKLIKKADVFIDIGAWIGTTSMYGSRKSKHVYAVEADILSVKDLSLNLSNNCININYTIINKAVYNKNNEIVKVPLDKLPIKLPQNINLNTKGNPLQHQEDWKVHQL